MGGICEYCDGGYWECGEGSRCVDAAAIEEDRTHELMIIGRVHKGCLQARLWVPSVSIPSGWEEWNTVPIRVQTFRAGKDPVARVYVPEPEDKKKKCPDDGDSWQEYTIAASDVDVHIAVREKKSTGSFESVDDASAKG